MLAFLVLMALVSPVGAALTPARADSFLRDFYAVYNATGAAKLADFYAADATLADPSFDLDLHGSAEIGGLLVKVLAKYTALHHEVLHRTIAGDDLIVEGMMIGELMGKTVRVRFVSVFHFRDGKIAEQRDLFDVLHFYEQLGVVPPAFRAKTGQG